MSQFKSIIRQRHGELGSLTEDKSSQFPSETIPNEAMTIPYLLSRYVQGIPTNVQNNGISYETDNFDAPDWEKMRHADLTDHEDLKFELEEIEEARKEQAKKRKIAKQSSPNTPPPAGTAEPRADRPAGDGAAAAAE